MDFLAFLPPTILLDNFIQLGNLAVRIKGLFLLCYDYVEVHLPHEEGPGGEGVGDGGGGGGGGGGDDPQALGASR